MGIGAFVGEMTSGRWSIGNNWRFYAKPRGNRYFRTVIRFSEAFKLGGLGVLGVGTVGDVYNAFDKNTYSACGQAGLNLSIGLLGYFAGPIAAVPGAVYFIASDLYGDQSKIYP